MELGVQGPRVVARAWVGTADRAGLVGLTLVATLVEAVLVWSLLSTRATSGAGAVVLPLMGLVGAAVGILVWAPGPDLSAAAEPTRSRRALAVAATLALPLGGVLGLVAVAGITDAAGRLPGPGPAALWTCLGVAAVAAARAWRQTLEQGRPARVDLLLPALLLVAVVLGVALLGGPTYRVRYLLNPASVIGFAALVVVPAALLGDAVTGLEQLQGRALRVERLATRRPLVGLGVLLAKVVLTVLVGVVAARIRPGWSYLHSSGPVWVAAAALAALGLSVLAVENRLGISPADHRVLVRGPGLLVSAALGVLVAVAGLVLLVSEVHTAPVTAAGLVALLVGGALLVHRGPRRLAPWQHAVGAALGVLGSLTVLAPTGAPLTTAMASMRSVAVGVGLLVAGAVVALVLLVVQVVRQHRLRLLGYGAAVAVWTVLVLVVPHVAPTWSALNLDLAFGVILLLAWTTWRLRLQRAVDGFEVVVAAVVTTAVLDTAVLLESLGTTFSSALLSVTLVAPGVVAGVRLWRTHEPAEQGPRRREVGRACTLYGLLLALVSVNGAVAANVVDQLGGILAQLLTLPLALLLVAATSAARPQPAGLAANAVPQ